MVRFIKYFTPTKKEADRIKILAFLCFHRRKGEPPFGLFTGEFDQEKPLERVGLYGNPDVFVHFVVGVTSPAVSARSEEAWEPVIALYHKNPWPVAFCAAFCIFIWNCLTGKREVA